MSLGMNERLFSRQDFLRIAGGALGGTVVFFSVAGCGPAEGGETRLTLGHFSSEQHNIHRDVFVPFAEEIAERSEGRIQVDIHPGGAMGPAEEQFEAGVQGVMDLSYGLQEYTPGRFPLTSAIVLPFLFDNAEQATRVFWELYQTVPELAAEYEEVKVLGLWCGDPGAPHTVNRPIETVEDLRGLRMRSPGRTTNLVLEEIGASPVGMPITEVYDALERGVIDGMVSPYSTMHNYDFQDLVGHTVPELSFYVPPQFFVMNRQTWEGLAPEDQELIEELTGEELSLRGATSYDAEREEGLRVLEERGIELHEVSEEALAQWHEAGEQVIDGWIEEREAQGLPGREVYEAMLELRDQS
ncbi:TRAP transporter substrate-binding protein [Rubrobacter taiwanensis]|uniref:TRAP transporter substrate-binding protein n=2 Tax=Rubrobacter taiwanensis TaxID=185139 RepID=A0A4V2NVB0_9ACTN|nr:TRAP transporter substrate-binding protein [Rubrobacter taiwanensis]